MSFRSLIAGGINLVLSNRRFEITNLNPEAVGNKHGNDDLELYTDVWILVYWILLFFWSLWIAN